MNLKPSSYFKLGLFVLASLAAFLVAAVAVGAKVADRETAAYHVFFDESVQGLDVGAPVKYRGVTIGTVADIDIAPDRRHVDVVAELDVDALRDLGLTEEQEGRARFLVPPGLRAQIAMQGLTGVKLILIDFFDPALFPAPDLPFPVPENSIPATSSLLKNVEDRFYVAIETLADVGAKLVAILERIDGVIASLEKKGLADKIVALVDELNGAVRDARKVVRGLDRARLPERMTQSLDKLDAAFVGLDRTLEALSGTDGVLGSAKRAADSFGELGQTANGGAQGLADTLKDVGEAAQAVRRLADALERDPDMLLKGRAKGGSR